MRLLLSTLKLVTAAVLTSAVGMETVYRWKYIDYEWESEAQKQQAINAGLNYTEIEPLDVDRAPDGRVFVAISGKDGVPATLTTVTDKIRHNGPLVRPYPNWSYFKAGDCNSIQNVYRVTIDECDRLWVLDNGFIKTRPKKCEAQLLAFDLKSDRLIHRIKIPHHIATGRNNKTLLATPIVETSGRKCKDTTVYMADIFGFGLIVWNNGNLVRLENPAFEPNQAAENVTTGKFTTQWPDAGIVTMALSPPSKNRYLLFHSLASFDLHAATTANLKSATSGSDLEIVTAKNILSSQAVGMAFSAQGVLFIALTKESAIACWNRHQEMKRSNFQIVAQDNNRLQYVNGMKIIRDPNSGVEEVWTLDDKLVAYGLKKLNFNEYNFYVLKSSVNKLIAGTKCEMPHET